MSNKIEKQISYLNEIADWWIKEDKFHHEFKNISTTLDSIKQEIEKWEGSKEQIKKIIKFLDNQIQTIPSGDFTMTNKLNQYKNDYIQLLQKQNKEENSIITSSKKDINQIVDENIAKWLITEEKTKKQINFSEKQKKTFESKLDLNNLSSYTVKSWDNLWNITKKHYPKFTKTNKDIIHIVNYIVNFNTKLEPQKLRHLMRDDKLAWWKKWSDGIAWDTLRVGDILKLPKIKTSDEVIILPWKKEVVKKDNNSDSIKNKPKTAKKTDISNDSEINEVNSSPTYTEHYIFKNWRSFLVLEDWTTKENSKELSKEDLDKIKSFEKVAILNEILDIWKTEANNIVDWLFWKSARKDDDIINNQIKWIEKDFSNLYNWVITNKSWNSEPLINSIFEKIQKAESEESIIGSNDMKEIKKILLSDNLDKDEKLIKIFNLMRYKWLSWNSTTIKEKVANHLLIKPEFKNISEILNNKNLLKYIENNNKDELNKLIWNKEISEEILEAYKKIKVKQEKHRDEYSKILEKINKNKKVKWEPEILLNDFIELNVNYSIQTLVKHTLIESQIESMPNRWNENSDYTWIYANLSGLSSTSSWDVLVIADDNIDTAIDIWTTLAISAVTMWVWMIAARGAMMAVNYWSKALKIWQATSRAWSLVRFVWTAGIEWTSFYMWTNTMNNLVYWNFEGYNIWENNLNLKEVSKSIAFMWVLRWVSKIMKSIKDVNFKKSVAGSTYLDKTEINLLKIGKLTEKVPPLMFKNTSITWVLAEAWLLTWTSTWIEIAFEWEWNWSWEEYMQALIMVWLFRWVWKIKFSKDKNGNIQAETTRPVETIKETTYEKYIHKKTWKEYIKWTDWKFREPETWKVRNVKVENLQKVENNTNNIKETISEKDYDTFIKTWKVSDELLNTIAVKIKKWEKLSKYEESIFTSKTNDINNIIAKSKKEIVTKKINSLFEKQFTKQINDEWKITIWDKTYKKRSDWKYEITWDNDLYTKKEILSKIKKEDKVSILEDASKKKISELEEWKILKLKDWFFDWKWKYKVSKDEIIIKENWKERKLSAEEKTQFYKDNYQEILWKMWLNIKKDSENIINKIKDKLNWSKWADLISSINKFLDSVPGLWHIYKWTKWIWKQWIDSILTPYHVVKNIKNAKWFEETMKSIIFANKDIGYLKWTSKVIWALAIPTIWEIIYETNSNPQWDMKLSWSNIFANYWELMYLWVINTLIIESLNIDEALLNETP